MGVIKEALHITLDLNHLSSSSPNPIIRRDDFGCSTGLTSIQAIDAIIQCFLYLIKPIKQPQFHTLDFQAIFNDLPTNDFNTLFSNLLPERRQYYAMVAPGSLHGCLSTTSLHLAYSSCALHWLSHRIYHVNSPAEVIGAYSAQFGRDIEAFLSESREGMFSEELMYMAVPGELDWVHDSQTTVGLEFELLGSCLVGMADEGIISKAKVESFNLTMYFPSEKALMINRNKFFHVERIQTLSHPKMYVAFSTLASHSLCLRATFEGLLLHHFGNELIIDDLFHRHLLKVAKSRFFLKPESHDSITFFVVLKRKKSKENMQ
ncbi:hypothetical protein BT93_C2582 [Corymbia citriodora subsp. variegata]|nr:hypothetical protein BT93_C2582 [Corymbia citriodora subsp. variegata]